MRAEAVLAHRRMMLQHLQTNIQFDRAEDQILFDRFLASVFKSLQCKQESLQQQQDPPAHRPHIPFGRSQAQSHIYHAEEEKRYDRAQIRKFFTRAQTAVSHTLQSGLGRLHLEKIGQFDVQPNQTFHHIRAERSNIAAGFALPSCQSLCVSIGLYQTLFPSNPPKMRLGEQISLPIFIRGFTEN